LAREMTFMPSAAEPAAVGPPSTKANAVLPAFQTAVPASISLRAEREGHWAGIADLVVRAMVLAPGSWPW